MATEQRDVKFVLSAQDRASSAINGLRSNMGALGDKASSVNNLLGKVGVVFGGAFTATTLTAFIKGTADGIDGLNDLADATLASINNLSALEDIGARAGVSLGDVGTAVLKLSKLLGDAKPGSEQANLFKAMGLDAAELRKLDPAEALRRVAVALNGYADNQNKGRIQQELFGKATRETAKFLKDLGKETELVGKVSDQAAEDARKFGDLIDAIGKDSTDAARALVGRFLPAINSTVEGMRQSVKDGTQLRDLVSWFARNSPAAITARAFTDAIPQSSELQRLQNLVIGLENIQRREPDNAHNNAQLERLREQVRLLEQAARFRTLADTGAGGGRGSVNPDAVRPSLPDIVGADKAGPKKKGDFIGPDVPEFLREAQRAIDDVDSAKLAALSAQLAELVTIRAARGGGAVDEAILKVEEQIQALTAALDPANERTRTLNALLAGTPSAKLAEVRKQVDLLSDALKETSDPGRRKQIQEAIDGLLEGIDAIPSVTGQTYDELAELNKQAARNIQSTLGQTLYATFKGSTDDILELWVDLLLRMAAEAAAAQLGKYLLGDGLEGLGGKIGSGIGSLFSLFGGFFADGGRLGDGKWGIAGEKGPELITGPATVTPMSQASAPAGGNTYVTNHVAAGVQRHEVLALLNQYGAMLLGQVDQRMRRAGVPA